MKVAIVGSRRLGDSYYEILKKHVPLGCSEVVSGGAVGVDQLAERYAKEARLKCTVILPDYTHFDRTAPLIRNRKIIEISDYVLILWDGVSRGTLQVIMSCIKLGKPYKLLLFREDEIVACEESYDPAETDAAFGRA